MTTISVLGSTGSIGTSTLDVVAANTDLFSIYALTAHKNVDMLAKQAIKHRAKMAVIADETLYQDLKDRLSGTSIDCAAGNVAVVDAARAMVDITMAGIVGMAGLSPLLAAMKNGKKIAIANKEPLVAAGTLVQDFTQKYGCTILPVDSEHNAIFQVMESGNENAVRRIILTASGGPFRTADIDFMARATPAQALAHPNWVMGQKISIDSASMMNKALEVIEAHYLFNLPPEKIDVLVHPQSVIHSMVEYCDGSVLAQMGASDMKVAISHALGWPRRLDGGAKKLDFSTISSLTFEAVDDRRFPAINMAYDSLRAGPAACIAMNAANEVAVDLFLKGEIGFMDILDLTKQAIGNGLSQKHGDLARNLEDILAFDAIIRHFVHQNKHNYSTSNRKVS